MTSLTMTREMFLSLLDTHGANLATWPEAERASAEALLVAQPECGALLQTACAVDALLRQARPKAPEGLLQRVLKTALVESVAETPVRVSGHRG